MKLQREDGQQVEAQIDQRVYVLHLGEVLWVAGFESDVFGDLCLILKGSTGVLCSEVFGSGEVIVKL